MSMLEMEKIERDIRLIEKESLVEELDYFPFESLPTECQLCVFSLLNAVEKARITTVCKNWYELLSTPRLWTNADFSILAPCRCNSHSYRKPVSTCEQCASLSDYARFKKRAYRFVDYLVARKAVVKMLQFQFDLQEENGMWLKLILDAIKLTNVRELSVVDCSWTITREKPTFLYASEDFVEGQKNVRMMGFQKILMTLLQLSPKIQAFRFEFDWSEKSVELLTSFVHIRQLELYRFWVYRGMPQSGVNTLLSKIKKLVSLKLEVWIPYNSDGFHPHYHLKSPSLKYLDIATCKGFFLGSVNFPKLQVLIVARLPWTGPLLPASALEIPCLYDVLSEGAPQLEKINDHVLHQDWRVTCYPELDTQLKHTCYCNKHKRGWAL
ncbi:uncharacterized protein LOC144438164 [Glandiceps talaboti]